MLKALRAAAGHRKVGYNYYDTSYWEDITGYGAVDPWRNFGNESGDNLTLRELGTWVVGFRPVKLTITVQFPSGYDSYNQRIRVLDYNGSYEHASLDVLIAEGTGQLVKDLTLDFVTQNVDIGRIVIAPTGGSSSPDMTIHDIWFYD